jgi:hypothetical protein
MSRLEQVLEQLALALPPPPEEDSLPPLPDTPLPDQILSPPMQALMEKLRGYVRQDIYGFLPAYTPEQLENQREEEKEDIAEAMHTASESAASAAIAAALDGAESEEEETGDTSEVATDDEESEVDGDDFTSATVLEAGMEIEEQNKFLQSIAERLKSLENPELPDNLALDISLAKNLSPAELLLYDRLAHQTALLSDPEYPLEVPMGILQRIKQAISAVAQGRAIEGHRILKNARQLDVRSAVLAFFLSQLAYFRVHQGAPEHLPEAREEGYRAASAIDALPPECVQYYRYIQVCCERALNEQRAIELMREHYLLSPETLSGSDGILGRDGVAIKTLLLLATIDLDHWTRFEFESLGEIAKHTCGGLIFYTSLFRSNILERQRGGRELIFEQQSELEHKLTLLYQSYEAIAQVYHTDFNTHTGLPKLAGNLPWCVQARYLQIMLTACDFPNFDEVLWHLSLDGRRVAMTGYPNEVVNRSGISHMSYWQAWNLSLRPSGAERRERVPCIEVGRLGQAMHLCGLLLEELTSEENAQVDFDTWKLAEPHLGFISYNQLCNISRKVSMPEGGRGPSDPFYKPCYRAWLPAKPVGKKPSEVIRMMARSGAFSDIYEVVDALTGAIHLLHDSVYGLVPRVEEALKMRVHNTPEGRSRSRAMGHDVASGAQGHFSEFWWFYFLIVPTAVLTFMTIVATGTYSSGLKLLGLLGGVFAVGGYMAYKMNNAKKNKK